VPFRLEASIENEPQSTTVKWSLNNVDKSDINETISEDGMYIVTAKIYKDSNLLKTITTQVVATKKVEIASIDVDITKENSVFVTDESNSSLAGTKIIVPKGALKENTKITVKKSSVNSIPNTDGISISDVLALEPSGLTFDKPVQVRISYNDNIDLKGSTVRIARYSKGGKIDYIDPLYIDTDTHEVVFETEHFTMFELQEGYNFIDDPKIEQSVIQDIEQNITGSTNYTNEDWEEILNVRLDEKHGTTIYDLYLNYKRNKEIVKLYDDGDYLGAYKAFYSSAENVKVVDSRWNDIANIYGKAKLADDIYIKAKENIYTLMVTKKYLSQIASNFGVIVDSSPLVFVKEYTDYVFTKAFDILDKTKDMEKYSQIKYFFTARKGVNLKTINKALMNSCESKEHEIFTIANGIYAKDGLLRNGTGANYFDGRYEYTKIKQFVYSANLIYELIQNFKSQEDTKHRDTLRNIITDIKTKIDYDSNVAYYGNHQGSNFKETTYFSPIAMNTIKGKDLIFDIEINTRGYTATTFTPVFVLKDENRTIIAAENSNYIVSSEFTSTGVYTGVYKAKLKFNPITASGVYGLSYFIRNGIQINDDHDLQLYNITVKEPKTQTTITGFSFQDKGLQKDSNGNVTGYKGWLTPTFASSTATPPCNISFNVNGNPYGRGFTIPKDDFNATSNLQIYIEPIEDAQISFIVSPVTFSFNLKAKIDRALAGQEDTSVPSLKIVKKNGVNIDASNQRDNIEVTTDDTLTFSVDASNIDIITKSFKDYIVSGGSGNNTLLYTVKYTNEGQYSPKIKVTLKNNGTTTYINAPTVSVSNVGNINPSLSVTEDTTIYKAGDTVKLDGIVISDNEDSADALSVEWSKFFNYSNINIINANTQSSASFIAPTLDQDKTFYFKVTVKDQDGGIVEKNYSVKVAGNPTLTKQLTFEKETYADGCTSYAQQGCEKTITSSDPEIITKSWTLKNSGTMTLSNLKMVPADSDKGNILTYDAKIEPAIIAPNEEFTITLTINTSKNVADGVYGERWYIEDENFNFIKFPEINGVSVDAQVWYKFNLNRGVVTEEKTLSELLTGKTFYDASCGTVYTSYLQDSNILTTGDDGSSKLVPYRIVGNSIYMNNTGTEELFTLEASTNSYVQLRQENNKVIRLYFSKTDASNNSDDSQCSSDETLVNDLVNGTIDYRNDIGEKLDIPSDMWVRIVPQSLQNDTDGWDGPRCKVSSSGDFGQECYVYDENSVRNAFAKSGETFQAVVYKEHLNPYQSSISSWNCREDVYKYFSNNATLGEWSNITVMTADYEDRSGDVCGEIITYDPLGSTHFQGNTYKIQNASSYMSNMPNNPVQIFLRTSSSNADTKGGLQFTLSNFADNDALKTELQNNGTVYIYPSDLIDYGIQYMLTDNNPTGVNMSSAITLTWLNDNDRFSIEQDGSVLDINGENLTFDKTIVQWTNQKYYTQSVESNNPNILSLKFGSNSYLPIVENKVWTYSDGTAVKVVNYNDLEGTFTLQNINSDGQMQGIIQSGSSTYSLSYSGFSNPDFMPIKNYFGFMPLMYDNDTMQLNFQWEDSGNSNGYTYINRMKIISMSTDITIGNVTYPSCMLIQRDITYPDGYDWSVYLTKVVYYVKQGVGYVKAEKTWSDGTKNSTYLVSYQ